MDNAYILLLILKKHINIGNFIAWYNNLVLTCSLPSYKQYKDMVNKFDVYSFYHEFGGHTYVRCDDYYDLGDGVLTEFEYSYLTSYLRLRGELR